MYTKPPAKKNTTRKSAGKKRTFSKAKKGKVYIPAYKVIMLCASIIAVCMALLLFTTVKEDSPNKEAPAISQRFDENENKPEQLKTNDEKQKADEPVKHETEKSKPQVEKPNVDKKQKVEEKVKTEGGKQKVEEKVKPKNEEKQKPQNKKFNFPPARSNAQLIFVFDDGGQNNAHLDKFLTLPFPITVAVLPQLANSVSAAQKVRASGNELMLHQPMQALNSSTNPGPGALTPDMDEAQIITQLFVNINQIGPVAGMNNHEGSLITANADQMSYVMKACSDEGIYFLDSRTNVETKKWR